MLSVFTISQKIDRVNNQLVTNIILGWVGTGVVVVLKQPVAIHIILARYPSHTPIAKDHVRAGNAMIVLRVTAFHSMTMIRIAIQPRLGSPHHSAF